jgi:hypothetical protein
MQKNQRVVEKLGIHPKVVEREWPQRTLADIDPEGCEMLCASR